MFEVGNKIELIYMGADPNPIKPGTKGTVSNVYAFSWGETHISVDWENGRRLAVILPIDQIRKID